VKINISGGRQFVGKMYFIITRRDTILVVELLSAFAVIVIVFCVLAFFRIIRSVVNYKRVVRLYYSDTTTGGHNWNWFVRTGDDRLQSFRRRKDSFAVVNLVFRNYRNYCLCNSIQEGEQMLAAINSVLTGELQKGEMCAHATMSNFALLLKFDNEQNLRARLGGFIDKLKGMQSEHNFDFQIGADIVLPQTNESGKIVKRKDFSIEDAYNNACAARATLSETEESGVSIFDSKLLEEQRWRDTVHEHQWSALKNEEFAVYYQPKYDPRTNILKGAEALIRWDSPEFGFVTPGRIIPIFEKNGFITEIDHYMLAHVARDQKAWLDAGYDCVPVSVNVSRAHFIESDLAEQIRDIADEANCPHELIEIELTESAFFDDKKAMIETIKRLKSYGFAVSMDDFGAGYSSLSVLGSLPLTTIKLDMSLIRQASSSENFNVLRFAIQLADGMRLKTVAEGVETAEQVAALRVLGCDLIQGYYFSRPLPQQDYENYLKEEQ
jgi:EAL domain-containing protein (putative c-di-GMP-specific phosphodiesterase class I)/GGDEF domain-containing protein